jgi:hypothetical protein
MRHGTATENNRQAKVPLGQVVEMLGELLNLIGALAGCGGSFRQDKEGVQRSRRRFCREHGLCPECESQIRLHGDKCRACGSQLPICRGIWRPTRRELTLLSTIGYPVLMFGGIGLICVLAIPSWRGSIFRDGSGLWPVLPIGAGALIAAFDLIRSQERIDKRIEQRLCPRCGYDVRLTRERCPECGTALSGNGVRNGMGL